MGFLCSETEHREDFGEVVDPLTLDGEEVFLAGVPLHAARAHRVHVVDLPVLLDADALVADAELGLELEPEELRDVRDLLVQGVPLGEDLVRGLVVEEREAQVVDDLHLLGLELLVELDHEGEDPLEILGDGADVLLARLRFFQGLHALDEVLRGDGREFGQQVFDELEHVGPFWLVLSPGNFPQVL